MRISAIYNTLLLATSSILANAEIWLDPLPSTIHARSAQHLTWKTDRDYVSSHPPTPGL